MQIHTPPQSSAKPWMRDTAVVATLKIVKLKFRMLDLPAVTQIVSRRVVIPYRSVASVIYAVKNLLLIGSLGGPWWHHWLNEHEFEQTPGDSEGQGGLVCCRPWGSRTQLSGKIAGGSWSALDTPHLWKFQRHDVRACSCPCPSAKSHSISVMGVDKEEKCLRPRKGIPIQPPTLMCQGWARDRWWPDTEGTWRAEILCSWGINGFLDDNLELAIKKQNVQHSQ